MKASTRKKPKKRLQPLPSELPLTGTAAAILTQRLAVVLYYLPRVAERADEDDEYVHQLRVSARRSTAALDAYPLLLPRRRRKKLRNDLRDLRKALGEARDLDVMQMRLSAEAEKRDSKKLRRVVRMLAARRVAEQDHVITACHAAVEPGLLEQIQRLIAKVRWRGETDQPDAHSFHAALLRAAVDRFFASSDTTSQDPLVLHAARLEAKRLRYTLELIDAVLRKSSGTKAGKLFKKLQESLGQISDHAVAAELFDRWADDTRVGATLSQLAKTERSRLADAVAQFHADWPPARLQKLRGLLETLAADLDAGTV